MDYSFTGASGGTATINATPANLSAIAGGSNANFLVNGIAVQSAYLTATSGTTGTVTGSGSPVKISLAGSTYWNGAGLTSALSNPANWTNGLPATGTELDFGPVASVGSTTPNNDSLAWSSTTSAAGLRFLGTSLDGVNSAAYTLAGNPLVFTGPINNDSTNDQVLDLNITLASGAGTINTVTNNMTFNGVINSSGAIGITKTGAGSLILAGSNTYTGGTTVSAGVLQLGVQAGVPDNSALTISGGTLDLGGFTKTTTAAVSFRGGATQDGTIVNNGAAYDAQAGTVSASLQGTAGLNKTTGGTLVLSGSNGYSGTTTLAGGLLTLANSAAVPPGSTLNVTVNGLAFAAGIGTFNLGGLAGTGNIALADIANAAVTLQVGSNGANTTYSGTLSGAGSLTKTGSGTTTLAAANTYIGATTVQGGILVLQGNNQSTSFTAASGGTLQMAGNTLQSALRVADRPGGRGRRVQRCDDQRRLSPRAGHPCHAARRHEQFQRRDHLQQHPLPAKRPGQLQQLHERWAVYEQRRDELERRHQRHQRLSHRQFHRRTCRT